MITTAILNLLYIVLHALLSPILNLNDVSLDSAVVSSMVNAKQYIEALNVIIPVEVIIIVFGWMVAIEVGYFTYKAIMWVIKIIRGSG